MATESCYERLYNWMFEHRISYPAQAKALGIFESEVCRLCNSETVPVERHQRFLALGIPEELLPIGRDRPKGRPRTVPFFPGLAAQKQESLSAS